MDDEMTNSNGRAATWRIALVYALCGGIWILLSDRLLAVLVTDPRLYAQWQTYKGWLFVAVTSALLFALLRVEWQTRRFSEEALRDSERRFRSLFERVPIGLYRTTADGQILDANQALVEMLGYPDRKALLAVNAAEIFADPAERTRQRVQMERTGSANDFELQLHCYDGTAIWMRDSVRAIKDVAGRVLHYEGSLKDITERRQAEAQRDAMLAALARRAQELQALYETSLEVNAQPHLEALLPAIVRRAVSLVGASMGALYLMLPDESALELVVSHEMPGDFIGLKLRPGEGLSGRVAQSGQPLMVPSYHEWAGRAPAYERTPARRVLGVPLKAGERVIGVINVGDDQRFDPFSEEEVRLVVLFADQAAIAVANARLMSSLCERTAELEARNAELDAFAHTVAHDLKNPLAHIVGYAQLLAEGLAEMPDDEKQDCLDYVARTAVKMSNIVDELLLLAEVRKMDIELAPLDMASIVDEAQTRLAHMIAERHAEIVTPAAWPPALGYAAWVEEVWVNYLSNALKYGGTPPQVELGFSTADRGTQIADLSIAGERSEIRNQKSEIRFWVRDNGPGFDVADPEQLFLPFTRLNQVHAQGHGLGLSIVRCIVEKLGGQVAVESAAGQGSVFSFTLLASETAFSG